MKKIAVFPGSFDPPHKGHEDIVIRMAGLFDHIIVAVGYNSEKSAMFPIKKRLEWAKKIFGKNSGISIKSYKGLTVNFCLEQKAGYIIRGLRNTADFEFERGIATANRELVPEIETVFVPASPVFSAISSSIVRDIIRNGGDASSFLPKGIEIPRIK